MNGMRKKLRFLCIGLVIIMLAGCARTAGPGDTTAREAEKAYPISFIDDDGVQINLDAPAQRIISLYSAHTENLYALGAGDLVIGGHTTCVYPPEAVPLATFDYTGDPEYVIAAEPDLVLIRPFIRRKAPNYIKELEKAGVLVVSLYPENYDDFSGYIMKLALLTGTEEKAEQMLSDFYADIEAIAELTSTVADKQTVFFESTETNIRTVSADSMAARAITLAGGLNLAAGAEPMTEGSSIAEFGVEKVLQHADDIDVYISQRGAMNSGGNLISIGERAGYDTIKAVRNDRVYLINEKLISSPTFRYYKGICEVARFLYPELMDDLSGYENQEPATKTDFANIVVRSLHLPAYVPSSSKYYQTKPRGHSYGMFEDVHWTDSDFDYIETAVYSGYVEWEKGADGKEYFNPTANLTRDELAKAIFVMGDFEAAKNHTSINDLKACQKARIVQILVDNGVFALNNGNFEPARLVTNQEILAAMQFVK
jgi:iron complex transport system substrate-binding protein